MATWQNKTIADVCENSQYGYTTKASDRGSVKFVRTTDISHGTINWDEVPYCQENPDDIEKYQLKRNDVLISRAGSVGLSYLIEKSPRAVFASYLIRFRPKINAKFFYYFLQSPSYWNQVNEGKAGIAVPNLNASKISSFEIPVPTDVAEQERIANKIDGLFSEIETGVKELESAMQKLDLYRQSILNAAIRGKLVPQDSNDEPTSVLLEKIRKDKEQLVLEKQINKEKPLKPISKAEIAFELPDGWSWVRLGDVLTTITDYHANGSYEKLKSQVLIKDSPDYAIMVRTTNFSDRGRNDFIYVDRSAYNTLKKSYLVPGDLIMNKIADPGAIFITPDYKQPMTLAMNLFLLKTNQKLVNNRYIYSYLKLNQQYVKSFAKGSTTMTITKDAVRNLIFPLPPTRVQSEIANILERTENDISNLFESIKFNEVNARKLKQSILKKAFEGEL